MKSKRTKACEISPETRRKVEERDGGLCIFCHKPGRGEAHFIPRSHGGLGIEENILTVCRPCHERMDNSTLRPVYLEVAEKYLRSKYPEWNKDNLVYMKGH